MRVISRFVLVAILLLLAVTSATAANEASCPLTLVSAAPPSTAFELSPTGVFRSGNLVYVLRGQVLSTYNVTALGDMSLAREDFVGSLAAREQDSTTAFNNGFLYISSGAGLEIFDLRNVRTGGGAPLLVSRTAAMRYERLVVNGNMLAALNPANEQPCYPDATFRCSNRIDLIDVSNPAVPTRVGGLTSLNQALFLGFNDVAFNNGFLWATTDTGTFGFNITNPANPSFANIIPQPGRFLASNGTSVLAIGDDDSIHVVTLGSGAQYTDFAHFTLPALGIDRANPIVFHPEMWIDDASGRLITMIDERDPLTLEASRTIAFDVFDFTVLRYEGAFPRQYETISTITPDEVKYNPVAVGSMIYTVGPRSGLQTWGACGQVAGRIEVTNPQALTCAGAEIHGWVTGAQKIVNVELFVDATSLGTATLNTGSPRIDISSNTPVSNWRINVNLDQLPRGEHILRAVGTDILGNRRQFSSERVFFGGPGTNCTTRRRSTR